MEEKSFVLYDLTSNDVDSNKPWSPSTWKIHVLLRQVEIPYNTIYLDFPDLAITFTALKIVPNSDTDAHGSYTVPVLHFPPASTSEGTPSSEYIMDSDAIIRALHDRGLLHLSTSTTLPVPQDPRSLPTLVHSISLKTAFQTHTRSLGAALSPFILPAIAARIPPRSEAWYRAKHQPNLPIGISSFEELRDSTTLEGCFDAANDGIKGLEVVAREARKLRADDALMTWEEISVLALLAFFGRIDGRLWEGIVDLPGGSTGNYGDESGRSALKELWCEAERKGLVLEVF